MPIRIAKFLKILAIPSVGKNMEGNETLTHCWWYCKTIQTLQKIVWQLLTKLNAYLPYDPDIPILDIYLREMKVYVYTKTYIPVFTAVFIMVQNWKKLNCPKRDEWDKQTLVNPKHRIIFSKQETTNTTTWINLKISMLNERSQTKEVYIVYKILFT